MPQSSMPSSSENLTSKLAQRLAIYLQNVDLDRLSRITKSRLAQTALPNIGQIELVSADQFATLYNELYISMFTNIYERERSDLIIERLRKEFAGQRAELAPYRIVGIRDHGGKAIGAAQFSMLLLPCGKYAVPYLQYVYVRKENRKQNMAEVLHTLVLAVSTAVAGERGNRTVPFTLFETEPPEHGDEEATRAFATQRAMIHTKAGAVAMMFRSQSDGSLLSPHVQPGLEPNDPPLTLVWAIRQSPASLELGEESGIDINEIGPNLIQAYYQSLRDEGFPEANIQLAESLYAARRKDRVFILMPLADVVLPNGDDQASK